MADQKVKLTTEVIKKAQAAAPEEKTGYVLWDTEIPGLGCRVTPRGKKTFVLYYRTSEGTRRKPRIGAFGQLTVHQAREVARRWLGEVALGGDPSRVRKDVKQAPTVAELCDRYLEEHAQVHKKRLSIAADQTMIRKYIKPKLGQYKVASVDISDIEKLLRSLRGTPVAANRVRALLSKMFNLAEKWKLRTLNSNPCMHVERYPEQKIHRPLTETELATLSQVLIAAESEENPSTSEDPRAIAAIRLLLLTGCRRNEILRLRWDEVDKEARVLRLKDSKTGRKVIWLNSAAMEVIEAQEPEPDNPFVFPSSRKPGSPLFDVKGVWSRVRERADLEDVRLHDLRHGFAATAAAGGLSLHQIGQLLGHRNPSTTARYSDLLDDPARRASEQVGEALKQAMKKGNVRG